MKARLEEAGKDGPPPAYVFLGDAQTAATEKIHRIAATIGALESSDYMTLPPGPAPGPSPSPPDPAGGAIPKSLCDHAKGILDKEATACCPLACGGCGGKHCNKDPGGNDNCCTKEVKDNKRKCIHYPAPCH